MAHIAERMTSHYQGIAFGYEVTTCPDAVEDRAVPARGAARDLLRRAAGVGEDALRDAWRWRPPTRPASSSSRPRSASGSKASDYRARGEELPSDLAGRVGAGRRRRLGLVRALIGLDQCEAAISGAAPIAVEVFDFFRALGVPISEIYGM